MSLQTTSKNNMTTNRLAEQSTDLNLANAYLTLENRHGEKLEPLMGEHSSDTDDFIC